MNDKLFKDLKVGDQVISEGRAALVRNPYRIGKVQKITPTGRIVTDIGTFTQDGRAFPYGGWESHQLLESTVENFDKYYRANYIAYIESLTPRYAKYLSSEQLQKFSFLLREAKKLHEAEEKL